MRNRLRVLLVDDDQEEYILTRNLLADRSMLSREADQVVYDLEWVSSYDAALVAFKKQQHDVYLVDYHLGNRSGMLLLREAIESGVKAPIILMTGMGSYQVDLEAMQAGATDYLNKSEVTAPLLERTIRYAIERKNTEAALYKAQNELEQRVQERTQELAKANDGMRIEITERKRVESALRESETRFRSLAETTSSAIFIVKDFKIKYANPAVKIITGFEPGELLGHNFWELAHPAYQDALIRNGLVSQWAEDVPARFELKLLRKDHQERWVDITAGIFEYEGEPALVVTAFDITERDLAEKALLKAKSELEDQVASRTSELRQANQRLEYELNERKRLLDENEQQKEMLEAIIANAPEGIIVTDKEARLTLVNPAAERLFTRPLHSGLEQSILADILCYPDGTPYRPQELPLHRSALAGETITNVEMVMLWPDGRTRILLVNTAPLLDCMGALNGAIGIFQDITQMKQVEEEKRKHAAEIEVHHHLIQNREMERLAIARDLHDGPLQEMVGMNFLLSEALETASEHGDQNEDLIFELTQIRENLKQQINDIRQFCSDLRPPSLVPFGLENAIRSHVDSFQNRHSDINLSLDLVPDGQLLPEKVRLALYRIYQELMNNIIRHACAGDVHIRFELRDHQAELEIQDNGCGFDVPQSWVEVARQGHLGLVGAQERAEAVGGSMKIISSPGAGTKIRVSVPRD